MTASIAGAVTKRMQYRINPDQRHWVKSMYYDEITLGFRAGDPHWNADHEALEAAWLEAGVHPAPVARFSQATDAVGHFLLAGGAIKYAFEALKIWMQARAGRKVQIKLSDGTEIVAGTIQELEAAAAITGRLKDTTK